ncbi:transcription factor E2F7 [Hyla sarda]|uniref:transcription factor E2F7 n=1 Tax=Hyla sarda TaxID=327740 RepID=UPI0024C2173A|nr:transcription factor E2F7 [Hyla sarda]
MEITGCLTLKDLMGSKKAKGDQEKDARSSQKENMCDRYRISPRVSLKGEPIDLSKQKGFTPERYPITPVKVVDRTLADPWTPTANLKMLSSVASPEIRDREKKKELFRPIENNEQEDPGLDAQQFETVDDLDDLEKRPSRKQKSLGLLCQKFLARYPSHPISTEKTTISLDEAASSLGVERRRIYDIVNVLESLHLVSRVAKNQYCWHGQHNLNETLRNLQWEGERQKYSVQIAYFQHKDFGTEQRKDSINSQTTLSAEMSEMDCPSASASSRKDKSLRIMSQKFVMLFLVSTTRIITLEIAAKILIEESQDISDHSKFKTKVRRLYDIANVLTSLGLIKKVHVTEERGRKPAFKWIGPVDFKTESGQKIEGTVTTSPPGSQRDATAEYSKQQKLLRHSSFSHVQSINTVKRKVCSEPSSPHKAQEGLLGHVGYSFRSAHLETICRQEIEEDSKGSKIASNPAHGNVGHLPFSVVVPVPVDPDYCTRDSGHLKPSVSPNEVNSQLKLMASSNAEYSGRGFLPNQPYMYVPSTSVFMLCGNPGKEKPVDVLHGASNSSHSDPKIMQDGDQPAKRQRIGSTDDSPLPLVVPKVCSSERNSCDPSLPLNSPCKEEGSVPSPACQEETPELLVSKGQEPQEQATSSALPQYLYVPSSAGLNGFNFFLPASQATGALSITQNQLSHVPYVMVPSTALAAFPFICSPAVTSAVSASSDLAGSMNYSLPGMTTSPPHIMFGTPSVVSPLIPEPSPDMQQSFTPASASLQSSSSVTSDSSLSAVQLHSVKNQKSPTPLTPKSIRPVHKDTFFKTPGSLGVSPALRKNERAHVRNSSSVQRRLDICSTTDD